MPFQSFCTSMTFSPMAVGAPGLLLEIARGGEMVGMGMGVEDPLDLEPLLIDIGEDRVGIDRCRRA